MYTVTEVIFFINEDITADETAHLTYGIKILKLNPSKRSRTTDDSKMPVSVLNALPRAVEQYFHPGLQKADYGVADVRMGRYITFLFSLLALIIVFKWSSELYGPQAGLFSMGLFAICPNWLAHSGLVTTDAYSVTIYLLVFYFLWKYLQENKFKFFLLFCISLGAAQIIKQTFIHLYVCIPLLIFFYIWINKRKITLKGVLIKFFVAAIINLVIINAGFLFYHTGQSLNEYVFVSRMFTFLQHSFSFMGGMPLPFPEPYLSGMDTVKYFDELGGGFPESTFPVVSILGHHEQGKSYWFYYLLTTLYKTPLPVFVFLVFVLYKIFQKANRGFLIKHEMLLLLPAAYFLVVMSLFNHIQIGVRHILFLYPVIYILCGKIITSHLSKHLKFIVVAGCIWIIISVYTFFDNYISYTNELIIDKKNAFLTVGCSNIDFGQGISAAHKYISEHPGVKFAPQKPQTGKFLISVTDYQDGFGLHYYDWLQSYKPVSHVHHSFLLIEVK